MLITSGLLKPRSQICNSWVGQKMRDFPLVCLSRRYAKTWSFPYVQPRNQFFIRYKYNSQYAPKFELWFRGCIYLTHITHLSLYAVIYWKSGFKKRLQPQTTHWKADRIFNCFLNEVKFRYKQALKHTLFYFYLILQRWNCLLPLSFWV